MNPDNLIALYKIILYQRSLTHDLSSAHAPGENFRALPCQTRMALQRVRETCFASMFENPYKLWQRQTTQRQQSKRTKKR